MERALITGVAGFIGSHLAAELLCRGWAVTGLDVRSPASDPVAAENLGELTGDPRFQFVAGDVTGGDLAMVCEGVRAVFHLAGLPGVRRSWGDRFSDYVACNVLGTQRLLEACVATDVPRLVFASSSSVYGPGTGKPSQEGDLPLPLSPYGVSKLAAERLCLAYASQRGAATSVVALRYFNDLHHLQGHVGNPAHADRADDHRAGCPVVLTCEYTYGVPGRRPARLGSGSPRLVSALSETWRLLPVVSGPRAESVLMPVAYWFRPI